MVYNRCMRKTKDEYMAKMGSRGGKKAAKGMTKKQLVVRAKKAVAAREKNRGKK